MKCPVDNSELTISDRSGVEIDFCPQCRGVWLDRGELDKIIDRTSSYDDDRRGGRGRDRRDDDDDDDEGGIGGLLGRLFGG
jgi:uncharacterized protein